MSGGEHPLNNSPPRSLETSSWRIQLVSEFQRLKIWALAAKVKAAIKSL
jgi:hypothetical protein